MPDAQLATRGLDTQAALAERVFSTGVQKSTHRSPDVNDGRLQAMIPPSLPQLLSEYAKAVRKAKLGRNQDILEFSAQYFAGMAAAQK
ncbi:hypothetical protein T492DRAFT_1060935 [Pavlovales sp. CCMP2436]|nr:hypothetical protein T492DRAFT_1060935 [Pavlovales sp. CCMP2436]